jgi:CheY-like chemotaxis protein
MRELSVLIVEDNEDDRFLTMRVIKKLPFTVRIEIARNGDEALRRILGAGEERSVALPSFMLLDLQLPKVGGIMLLERIRAFVDQSLLPVFILSSSDSPVDFAACNKLGISGYLPKPLDTNLLQDCLAREGIV